MRHFTLAALLLAPLLAQYPSAYRLNKSAVDTTASYMLDTSSVSGLASNSVVDIYPAGDSLVFFGTARGLSITPDFGISFGLVFLAATGQISLYFAVINFIDPQAGLLALSAAGLGYYVLLTFIFSVALETPIARSALVALIATVVSYGILFAMNAFLAYVAEM